MTTLHIHVENWIQLRNRFPNNKIPDPATYFVITEGTNLDKFYHSIYANNNSKITSNYSASDLLHHIRTASEDDAFHSGKSLEPVINFVNAWANKIPEIIFVLRSTEH